MNGLRFDRDAEERAIETFATNVLKAGRSFLDSGEEMPYVPSWNRVLSVYPGALDDFSANVAEDVAQYSTPCLTPAAVTSA